MWGQDCRNRRLELTHHFIGDFVLRDSFGPRDGFLQRTPLVHRRGGNHAPIIRERFHVLDLAAGKVDAHERISRGQSGWSNPSPAARRCSEIGAGIFRQPNFANLARGRFVARLLG